MSLEDEKKVNQDEGVRGLLKEEHNEELGKILAFGEKYKREGEEMKKKFWSNNHRKSFVNLICGYGESRENLEERLYKFLSLEEIKILDNFNEIERNKFCKDYLYEMILYSGNPENEYNDGRDGMSICYYPYEGESVEDWIIRNKDELKPGMMVNLRQNGIGDDEVKFLAKEWRDRLQEGMCIYLWDNKIGDEGAEVIAREWKDKLKFGMEVILNGNRIGDAGLETIVKQWKDCLQPGMYISLYNNKIGDEGVKILAKEWKDKLQPGMFIDLSNNNIGYEGIQTIIDNLELKEGVKISLWRKNMSDGVKQQLKAWEKSFTDKGINCEVSV